jgi:hypothetical protein
MTLLVLVALALQDPEPELAQDPKPEPSVVQDPKPAVPASDPTSEPVKKKKRKKQEQEGELPGAARPGPEDLKVKKPKKEDYQVDFRVGLAWEYNDNIIRLDKRDLEELKDGTKPEKFRITQPQDYIFSPWVEADLALHVLDERSTAGLRVTGHYFQVNSFASNGALNAFLKGKDFNVEYAFEPKVYRREYKNLDTGIFESAFYDDHLLEGTMKYSIERAVMLRPKIGVEARDYDAPFQYRSSVAPFVAPRAMLTLWKPLEPFLQYDFVWNSAFASGIQPDTSFIQNGVEVGLHSRLITELEMEANYRYEYRTYTTNNDPAFDPSHAGRTDHRIRMEAKIAWKPLSNLALEWSYAHWTVLSNIPGKPDLADEDSDWRRNEVLLGVTYFF